MEFLSIHYDEMADRVAVRSVKQRIELNNPLHVALKDNVNFARIGAVSGLEPEPLSWSRQALKT